MLACFMVGWREGSAGLGPCQENRLGLPAREEKGARKPLLLITLRILGDR